MGKATSVQVVQVGEALTGRPRQPGTGPWSLRVAPAHPGRPRPAPRPRHPPPRAVASSVPLPAAPTFSSCDGWKFPCVGQVRCLPSCGFTHTEAGGGPCMIHKEKCTVCEDE